MNWQKLIGRTVVAYRGFPTKKFGKTFVPLEYILFDDKETYIELDEQNSYDYHDCCSSARIISLKQNAEHWQAMFDKQGRYDEPDPGELTCPF